MSEKVHSTREETQEVPQELRMLRQLGNYAAKEVIFDNPVFRKYSENKLSEEETKTVRDQLDFMQAHVRLFAALGTDIAIQAKSFELASALQDINLNLPSSRQNNEDSFIHGHSLALLRKINELCSRKNYVQIAAAIYGLLRMASMERLMVPRKSPVQVISNGVRTDVHVAAKDDLPPSPHQIIAALDAMNPGIHDEIESQLIAKLEGGLNVYISGKATFREIQSGINAVITAKKEFYEGLAENFSIEKEEVSPRPGYLNLVSD